ncbi:protein DpdG [Sorangium sp. So ce291]|uniref:protein DpdG n=1 Tax=Sorangium sp. So ce291 TaxID=3133294 RepID=UPI003F61C6ED
MSILNRPNDGLLSVVIALRRALVAYGPQPEDRLLALCAPASVTGSRPTMARKTLLRWTQLGLFEEREGRVHLRASIASLDADDIDRFRAALLRLVLAPENNPEFEGEGGGGDEERTLASDFTRAAAWTLAQDVYTLDATWKVAETLENDQGARPRPIVNDTRWSGLAEWASFFGLASAGQRLVFDPAFAVRSVLDEVFSEEDTPELKKTIERGLDQPTFLLRLAQALPVVDGGRYRVAVEAGIAQPWRVFAAHEVSPSLTAALLHCEAAGVLRLESRSDAPMRVLLGRRGTQLRSFSHVVRTEDA